MQADAGDQLRRVSCHGQPVDPLVPGVVGREDRALRGSGERMGRPEPGQGCRDTEKDREEGERPHTHAANVAAEPVASKLTGRMSRQERTTSPPGRMPNSADSTSPMKSPST